MNHRTTVVVALIAATGLSTMVCALPDQRALGWGGGGCGFGGCGFLYPHHSINILSHSNQANNCSGNMAFCLNKLTNINCVRSICIIGDLSPWKLATPLPTSGSVQTTAAPNTNTATTNTAAANRAG